MPLDRLDLAHHGRAGAERHLDALATEEAETPFDLAAGPLIRFRLVRLAPAYHVLLLTVHHIAADGWSMGILFRELTALYDAFASGRDPDLPDLRIQYGDFADWQRERLTGAKLQSLLDYWRASLSGAQDLPLITDRPRPPVASFRGDFLDLRIDRATTEAVRKLGRANDCTLFQSVLTAFKAVLARFTGTTDVVVGAPIANRVHPGLEPLIGFFVNSVALRTDLSGDPGFAEMLSRVRHGTLGAYAHQDLPFERLVEELKPGRDLSRNPLFQVSFQIQNAPGVSDRPNMGGQDFRRIERSSAILDLALSLWETPDGLVGGIEYSTDLFDRPSVQALADALVCVLRAAAADPDIQLSALPLVPARAQGRLARQLQGPVSGATAPVTMTGMLDAALARHADATVLADAAGGLTLAELDNLSARVAAAYQQAGLAPGDVIGLALERGRDFVVCMLAAVRLGAVYLPMDPGAPPGRLQAMVRAAAPKIVLIEDDGGPFPHGPSGRVGELMDFAATCAPLAAAAEIDARSPCYVLFTSGSTGRPKAVQVSHGALANHMGWMRRSLEVTPEDRVLQRTPTSFDASIWEVWLPLVTGATLCLPPPFHAADARALHAAMEDFAPTIAQFVPSLLPHLLAEGPLPRSSRSVRRLCCGGEPLTADLVQKLTGVFRAGRVINLYGPTETTIDATWHDATEAKADPIPIGRPVNSCDVLIVDDHGALCPHNTYGEIAIGGRPLADGYLGLDDLTASRFTRLPGRRGRYFLTGDVGWYGAGGMLYCAGRKDRQVKLRGNRIELGEIETILQEHARVDQAAVILHAEAGEPALVAFVTLDRETGDGALRVDLEDDAVDEWEGLYRVVYGEAEASDDEGFARASGAGDDFTGWISSFDSQPIPRDQMRRWADETAARIAALDPSGIFEIGCGSGLMLSRLAPDCDRYVGCDLSAPVIARLDARAAADRLTNVSLHVARAQDSHEIEIGGCDTLLLNSVVQYLPSASHLTKVLARNAERMPADARLFIGDVRPLDLLRAFHAAVETGRAAEDAMIGELRKRVGAACAQEKELLLDPEYFRCLSAQAPLLGGDVTIRLKTLTDDNELCAYRFDVTIRLGQTLAPAELDWKSWQRGEIDHAGLERAVVNHDGPLAVRGIPNARVARAVTMAQLIGDMDAGMTRAELVAEADLAVSDCADPGRIAVLARQHGLTAELLPCKTHPERFDLVVHDGALAGVSIDAAQPGEAPGGRPLSSEPILRALTKRLAPDLRAHLAEHLPQVMCPARLSVVEQMPMLPNGKLDYRALSDRLPHEPVREARFEPPADPLQQMIADTFAAVLGVTQVGARDDFFAALGGHSLLATRAIARLRELLDDGLPLRLLFEHPTPAGLAAQIATDLPAAREIAEAYAAIQDLRRSVPRCASRQSGKCRR